MKLSLKILAIATLALSFVACGGDGENPRKVKVKTTYEIFRYAGSETGAKAIEAPDSLANALVRSRYFTGYKETFDKGNDISFEFLGDKNEVLTYIENKTGKTIISSYWFDGDDLYMRQNIGGKDTDFFVATKEQESDSYYRTMTARRFILEKEEEVEVPEEGGEETETTPPEEGKKEEGPKNPELFENIEPFTLQDVLEYAGFKDSESMTNPKDTIVWCNVKFIFQ